MEQTKPIAVSTARTGVQERENRFGPGDTKRVWEMNYEGILIGVNAGDITYGPTEAVVVPSEPLLRLEAGNVENALADAMGKEFLKQRAAAVMDIMDNLRYRHITDESAARSISEMLGESGLKVRLHDLARHLSASFDHEKYYGNKLKTHLAFGAAVPLPSGDLAKRGILLAVMANIRPAYGKPGLSPEVMADITDHACRAAAACGANSISVPAIGTGMAFQCGFGLSDKDSMHGFFLGAGNYARALGRTGSLKRIDFNLFVSASQRNAKNVADYIHTYRMLDSLKR